MYTQGIPTVGGSCITVGRLCAMCPFCRSSPAEAKPDNVKSLQARFLAVFWLLRMADWLQGPYFYEVYSSKIINGAQVSLDLVSKLFLVGFATTGAFGPWLGRLVDTQGRKFGTLLFAALYTAGALSTGSSLLPLLLLGRVAGGLGTSLLFSAPEAWLVGEHAREKMDGKWLGQTFGWAYAGDSVVAILAGQLASISAAKGGPQGPFTLSVGFLALGSLLTALKWKENVAPSSGGNDQTKPTIGDAVKVVQADKRILLVGAAQALFEGKSVLSVVARVHALYLCTFIPWTLMCPALYFVVIGAMYIFVLQWPPAIKAALQTIPWIR
jgi:MFS transporter, MFS domain-containing protein family, molybdate-anion transporter